ncbi:hypothetical protein Q5P01_001214 [Channa striata]|uniref:Uncharacterized protein n=1 Tax=Channa striata TaxID=64152 RepID=A0AA88NKA0_CHASR|nr:hypothetical protein Q5P01_001214 [Channa striata]
MLLQVVPRSTEDQDLTNNVIPCSAAEIRSANSAAAVFDSLTLSDFRIMVYSCKVAAKSRGEATCTVQVAEGGKGELATRRMRREERGRTREKQKQPKRRKWAVESQQSRAAAGAAVGGERGSAVDRGGI